MIYVNEAFFTCGPIPAGQRRYTKFIDLVRARGVSITGRVLCDSGTTDSPVMEVYYSPDGQNWDTIAYDTVTLTRSASAYVQATAYIVVPEHGYLRYAIYSGGTTDDISNAKLWYSIESHPDGKRHQHGSIEEATEDE